MEIAMGAELCDEIARVKNKIAMFDSLIPSATGLALQTFIFHRNWESRILSQMTSFIRK